MISLTADYPYLIELLIQTFFSHKFLFYSIKMEYPPKSVFHSLSTHSAFFFGHLTIL